MCQENCLHQSSNPREVVGMPSQLHASLTANISDLLQPADHAGSCSMQDIAPARRNMTGSTPRRTQTAQVTTEHDLAPECLRKHFSQGGEAMVAQSPLAVPVGPPRAPAAAAAAAAQARRVASPLRWTAWQAAVLLPWCVSWPQSLGRRGAHLVTQHAHVNRKLRGLLVTAGSPM